MVKNQNGEKLINSLQKGFLKSDPSNHSLTDVVTVEVPQSLEDVRVFDFNGEDLLVGTLVTEQKDSPAKLLQTRIGVSYKKSFFELDSPIGKRLEKNWVPIEIQNDILRLLHSNSPMRIVELDLVTGKQVSYLLPGTDEQINSSGGTPFLKMSDSSYLRIARKRFPLFGRGYIHISYLIQNSSSYRELKVSKPFIFQDFGFEICNGLSSDNKGNIYLSWGFNDSEMFFGECTYKVLKNWLSSNLMKKENQNSIIKSLQIMRKIKLSVE